MVPVARLEELLAKRLDPERVLARAREILVHEARGTSEQLRGE